MIRLAIGAANSVGKVRDSNQDVYLADQRLVAVADGMGGHKGGRTAAEIAVRVVREAFDTPSAEALVRAVEKANEEIFARGSTDPEVEGMGTTFCAVAPVEGDGRELLAVVNVGDSRVYLASEKGLEKITVDHTVAEEMVAAGEISRKEAQHHHGAHVLTRSLGAFPKVMVDSWELEPRKGDRYLLCSDGLYNELTDAMIAALLENFRDPQEAAQELLSAAELAGGRDNITVVVVDVVEAASAERSGGLASRVVRHVPGHTRAVRDATGELTRPVGGGAQGDRDARTAPERPPRRWLLRSILVGVGVALAAAVVRFAVFSSFDDYYVAFDPSGTVAIYQGPPGGVLWMQPTLLERTDLTRDVVPPSEVGDLDEGVGFSTLDEAEEFVDNLRARSEEIGSSSPPAAPLPPLPPPTPSITVPDQSSGGTSDDSVPSDAELEDVHVRVGF